MTVVPREGELRIQNHGYLKGKPREFGSLTSTKDTDDNEDPKEER